MESQPQNPEFRINPENFHLCITTYEPFGKLLTHSLVISSSPIRWAKITRT